MGHVINSVNHVSIYVTHYAERVVCQYTCNSLHIQHKHYVITPVTYLSQHKYYVIMPIARFKQPVYYIMVPLT